MQNNQKVLLLGGGTSSSMLLSLLFEQGGGGGSSTTFTTVNYNEGLTSTVYTANTGAGTVAMASTLDAAFFSFNTSTGELNFLSAPDFENPFGISNVYLVDLVTTDSQGEESTVRVTVRVQAVSDNAPTFSGPPPTPTTVTVAEDVSDQIFFTPTVSDDDLPPETLTYSIVGGADAGEFTIDATTGALRFTSPADADAAQTVFNVSLGVTDGTFSDTHALQVTVTDVADEVPVFTSGLTVSTPENNSAVFYTAQATADLSGSAITYTTTASGVTLDATSGELNFTAPGADFETATSHVIPITATDAQGLSATINLTVTVTDVDDTAPVFTSGNTVSVVENILGTVYTAVAVDASSVTYSLTAGVQDNDLFSIDGSSGAVTFNTSPDFEAPADADTNNVYDLTITATDGSANVATLGVAITVTDVVAESSVPTAYLDLDFSSNSYRLDDTASSFDAAFVGSSPKLTYGTTSNSTMTNSSGTIVWAPHNVVKESEDFSDTSIWLNSNMTGTFVAAPSETDPAGSNGAYLATHADTSVSGAVQMHKTSLRTAVDGGSSGNVYTAAAFFKKPTTNAAQYAVLAFGNNSGYNATATFDLTNVSVATTGYHSSAGEVIAANIVAVGSGWYLCSFTVRRKVQLHTLNVNSSTAPGSSAYNRLTAGDGTSGVLVWGAHVYRSDLGGMAPVPGAASGFETYVPTNGAVEYLPRVGHHVYDGAAWVNEGLLIESEARTNLVTYSQEFENSSWLKTNSSISGTLTSSPDGQTEGRTVTFSGTNNLLRFIGPSWTEGESYTASIWLRSGSVGGVSSVRVSLLVSDTSGSMVLTVNNDVTVTSDWQRVHVSGTAPAGTPGNVRMRLTSLEAGTLDVFGAQLELGATPSSYMPTNGSTASRDAQTLTVPPAELGWDTSGLSLAVEGRVTASDAAGGQPMISQWKSANTIRIDTNLRWNGSYQGNVQIKAYNGPSPYSAYEGVGSHSVSEGVLSPYSIAWRHTSSTLQAASSGSAISIAGTPNNGVPDLSAADMTIGTNFMGTISHVRQWDEDIGDTGIEEASS